MKSILLLLCALGMSVSYAGVPKTVSVSLIDVEDHEVRAIAKNKAILDSLDDLPNIVWGQEEIVNGDYSEHIESIGYAHAHVTVISESFDREDNNYTLVARVDYDQEAILNTLRLVADGRYAVSTLKQINKLINNADLTQYLDTKGQGVPPHIEATLFSNPYFYAQSYDEFAHAHESMVGQFVQILRERLFALMDQYSFTLVEVNKDHFSFRVNGPNIDTGLAFTSPAIEKVYAEYKTEIHTKAGTLCLFSPLVNRYFAMPKAPDGLSKSVQINLQISTNYTTRYYADELYKETMAPFDVVYCDTKTAEDALRLVSASPHFIQSVSHSVDVGL